MGTTAPHGAALPAHQTSKDQRKATYDEQGNRTSITNLRTWPQMVAVIYEYRHYN